MKSRTPLTLAALLAVATISGCREGCCDPINGYPLPNGPPRASQVEFPDPTLTAGQSLTVSGVESLFRDDDPLTLTATSSDTTVVVVSMQGCSVVDPDPHDGCPSPAAFHPTDVSGVWSGMIRDAIPVRFELVQLSPTISAGNPAELSGTVSITIGGEVETSGPVTGDTSALTCGTSDEASVQYISLAAVLSVKPNDNLDLALTLDFVGGHLQPHAVDGPLHYAGPTSVTFGPDGEVVGLELDSFTDFSTLTRVQR